MRFASLNEWLDWQQGLHPKSIDLGLARIRKVYDAMQMSSRPRPVTLTVGGTNGKGSSVAMLDSILRTEGYRVGAYTSPHLVHYNERIRIDGTSVADDVICEAFDRVDKARDNTTLSFFEFGTLAALDLFSRRNVDVQVLEVGLGGRLDAVNIIDPDGAMIASIDIDHQDWFGESREAIALEKAGILRTGRPSVIGDPNPPQSLLDFASASNIDLAIQGKSFRYEAGDQAWHWIGSSHALRSLPIPAIPGKHQLLNASAVLELLDALRERIPLAESSIREGLRSVHLAGRLQFVAGDVPVLLDVAHNLQSVRILADEVSRRFCGRRIHAVFAIMRDKDISGIISAIAPHIQQWYLAPLDLPRAMPTTELKVALESQGITPVLLGFRNSSEAFAAAKRNAQNGDLILIFGTFPLVAEFLAQND